MENEEVKKEEFDDNIEEKEYAYEKNIRQAKKSLKRKILSMSSKEEQLSFIKEEKIKYIMLKESSNTSSIVGIIICFAVMFIDLFLFGNSSKILIKILAFVIIGISAGVAGYLVSNMNDLKIKYTSVIMLLENFEEKITGSMWKSDSAYEMKKKIDDLQYDIKVLSEQTKINSKSIEDALDDMREYMNYRM